jgi:hypothetical protein
VTGVGGLNQAVTPVTYTNNTNVGTATGSASFTGDANHSASNASATFEITPAPSATVVTCPVTVVYNGVAQTVCTANVTGVGGLDHAVTVTYASNTNVGTATASAAFGGDDNHTASNAQTTFTITAAPATVTAGSATKVYGTADPTIGATSTGFVAADNITVSFTDRAAGNTVGSYATHATATGAALANYDVTYTDGALTITTAPLTVTAANQTRPYLNANPALTGTLTGVVAGDAITASYSTTAVVTSLPGAYPIVPALADPGGRLGNYAVSSVNGVLTITNAAPVCTAAVASPNLLWPPNHKMVPIQILGVTDPDGNPVSLIVTSIFQDEPTNDTGDGNTSIDGAGVGTSTPSVRAERSGDRSGQDGRNERDEHGKYSKDRDNRPDGRGDHYDGDDCDHDRHRKGHKDGDGCEHDRERSNGNGRVYHIAFTATDGLLTCTGEVTVGVPHDQGQHNTAIDDGPVYDSTKPGPLADDDSYTTRANVTFTVPAADGVLDNDSSNAATAVLVTNPTHGTVVLNPNGGFSYTPAANYVGTDVFTYRAATAGGGLSAPATVTIRIKKNAPPVADDDDYTVKKNTTLTVGKPGVMHGDTDPDGDKLTVVLVSSTSHGSLTLNADGSFVYKPATNYAGADTFTYRVVDVTGLQSAVATVTLNVVAHWDGDGCDHDRGKKGHKSGDGCDHDKGEHGGHYDGDGCDHDKGKKGHKDGDKCDHDSNMRGHAHHDGDDCDHDNHRGGHHKGDGCDHDRKGR